MTLSSFMKKNCLPFYCICYGKRKGTWKKTRYCSSFVIGSLCVWLMCKCLLKSFIVPKKYEDIILWPVVIIVAIGFAITDAIKCITLVIFITMMGKSGRSFLRALTFAFVISGPINNLSTNSEEIVRAFSCSKILAINLTRTRLDLMIMPFRKTLAHMKDDIVEVQNTFKELKGVTNVLNKEIIGNNMSANDFETILKHNNENIYNAESVENLYKNKFKKHCFRQLNNGKHRCKAAFLKALENCYENMPFILKTLICWPFKVDFVCKINIFGNPEKLCDSSNAVPKNFGEAYVELVDTDNKLYDESSDFKVNYTVLSPNDMPELKSAKETAKAIKTEFKIRKEIFNIILQILQQFLTLMIFKVFFGMISTTRM